MTQLKQIYSAALMYASDWPVNSGIPYVDDLPVRNFSPSHFKGYLRNDDVFYCPDTPHSARKRFPSSYSWRLLGFTFGPTKDEFDEVLQKQLLEDLEREKRTSLY